MRSSYSLERSFVFLAMAHSFHTLTALVPLSLLECLHTALADCTASGKAYACLTVVEVEVEGTDDDRCGDLKSEVI